MLNTREKLIALVDDYTEQLSVKDIHKADFAERFADHLIANGVTIPVRCKDCKHYIEDTSISPDFIGHYCDYYGNDYSFMPHDFCFNGERREGK